MDVCFCVPQSSELIISPPSSGHAGTGLSLHSYRLGHDTVVRHRGRSIKTIFFSLARDWCLCNTFSIGGF